MIYFKLDAWRSKCWLPGKKKRFVILVTHAWEHICIDNGYTYSSQDILSNIE
jgi:hypothetical protein